MDVWYRHWSGTTFEQWQPLGGIIAGQPVATWADADICVSAVGSGNDLWYRRLNLDVWDPWEPLTGIISGAPSATAPAGDDLYMFVQGSEGDVWHRHWNGAGFESWVPLDGFAGGVLLGVSESAILCKQFLSTGDGLVLALKQQYIRPRQ